MKLFSQRKGLKDVRNVIQTDSMDDGLRTGLWNALTTHYWNEVTRLGTPDDIKKLAAHLWDEFFKLPLDALQQHGWSYAHKFISDYFFKCAWYEVYDFIEYVANKYTRFNKNHNFIEHCNNVLERELSAYRFVDKKIIQITSAEEITAIENALSIPVSPVREHISCALQKIADRQNPDYRNSIKESISAVESLCCIIANRKASLGDALKIIMDKIPLHTALEKAFQNLYGYTSNTEGIRHALMDESSLSHEDAIFMLVSCSTFTNYLVAKASKAGIKLY